VKLSSAVAGDFDQIAAVLGASPSERTLSRAERFVLRQVPAHATSALDVSCGDGLITCALAARGLTTIGIDLSPGMIALARQRDGANPLIEYQVTDALSDNWTASTFDFVVSVAMAHHVPLAELVTLLVRAVAPGGTLAIQDVATRPEWRGLPLNGVAWLRRRIERLAGRVADDRLLRELYRRHGANEEYLSTSDVGPTYVRLLPGTEVHLRLEWRYTAVWRREPVALGTRR
jgi:2-polyprenyl-3-methyl-5-hydroxy-6-metoxy-1,4-benzoquinol methylase